MKTNHPICKLIETSLLRYASKEFSSEGFSSKGWAPDFVSTSLDVNRRLDEGCNNIMA